MTYPPRDEPLHAAVRAVLRAADYDPDVGRWRVPTSAFVRLVDASGRERKRN